MTLVLPRLDRASALALVARHMGDPLDEVSRNMPDTAAQVTYSPSGGSRIDDEALRDLRREIVGVAIECGMPTPIGGANVRAEFDGRVAEILRTRLPITAHEASQEEAWSYLTCCWMLDVAIWRFGAETGQDRFIGHVNRNTFRRLWWAQEVLGQDIDLTLLGMDETVSIMERPTLYMDRRVARAIVSEFLLLLEQGHVSDRMQLMREATKRILRLTPFLAFPALEDDEVRRVVADAFDAARSGLEGNPAVMPQRVSDPRIEATPGVEGVVVMAERETSGTTQSDGNRTMTFEDVALAALDIAKRTGRITNATLREAASITSDEAREVFVYLMARGDLERRGVKRGTYYVIGESSREDGSGSDERPTQRSSEGGLRRLLRRRTQR